MKLLFHKSVTYKINQAFFLVSVSIQTNIDVFKSIKKIVVGLHKKYKLHESLGFINKLNLINSSKCLGWFTPHFMHPLLIQFWE